MGKIIKITESDLKRIIKSVKQRLVEADTFQYNEIKGTTSPEPIRSSKVITDTGIKANDQNFMGSWGINDNTNNSTIISNMFRNKNLSDFSLVSSKPPYENYLQVTISRYKRVPREDGKGFSLQLDKSAKPMVNSVIGKGNNMVSKEFATYYKDTNDPENYIWRISNIVGAGNGLLALSRAVKETNGYPGKITISFNQSERTSGGYKYNSDAIGNIKTILNSITQIGASSLFNAINDNGKNGLVNNDGVQNQNYVNKSNDDLVKMILRYCYGNDKSFVPQEDIEKVKNKLIPYESEPFKVILNKLQYDEETKNLSIKFQKDGGNNQNIETPLLNRLKQLYGGINEELRNEYIRQYKNRIKSFLTTKYKPEQAQSAIEQINFQPIQRTIQNWYLDALKGVKYGKTSVQPSATQKTDASKYALGSSKPEGKP